MVKQISESEWGRLPFAATQPTTPLVGKASELDGRVQKASQSHFDEFSAPDPLVATILTAEAAGVAKNGLLIPAAIVKPTSAAAIGIGAAAGVCYCVAGLIMVAAGKILLPSCYADFKNARNLDSFDEKWRSSLNLLDKCLLIAIGVASCVVGVAMILTAAATMTAFAAAAMTIGSIVFAVLVTIRGVEMMMRGGYGLFKANQFQKALLRHCQSGDVMQWLYQEKLKDAAALKNRIGQMAFDAFVEALKDVDATQPIDAQIAAKGKYESLKDALNVGVCEERVKQQLILSIGTVMFLGGALSLVAIGLSHGVATSAAVMALGIAGSGFSLSMEALWMPYDNPKWFKQLARWSYNHNEAKRMPVQQGAPLPSRSTKNDPGTGIYKQPEESGVASYWKKAASQFYHFLCGQGFWSGPFEKRKS